MAKITLLQTSGSMGKEMDLPAVLEMKPNKHLLYEAVKCYGHNQRQGTAKTKTRAEVSGGGRKPFKQKGTGNARAGSNTSPLYVRGGNAHGPHPRDYRTALNKKARIKAIQMALGIRAKEGGLAIFESLHLPEPKTKALVQVLDKTGFAKKKNLLILEKGNANVLLAGRNIPRLDIVSPQEINVYCVLNSDQVLFTEKSFTQTVEAWKA